MATVNMEYFSKAQNGTYTINDTSAHEVDSLAIKVDSATVFSLIEIDGVASDVRNTYLASIGGSVEPCLITPGEGSYFSKVTLTSGQVTLIKK